MNPFLNIFNMMKGLVPGGRIASKPKHFGRKSTVRRILETKPDFNTRHPGKFKGGIVPFRRRMAGTSKTAGGRK